MLWKKWRFYSLFLSAPGSCCKRACSVLQPCTPSHNRACHNDLFSPRQLITRAGVSTKWIKSISVRSHVPKWLIISCHLKRKKKCSGDTPGVDHFIAWAKSIRQTPASATECAASLTSEMDVLVDQWIVHWHAEPWNVEDYTSYGERETMKSHALTFVLRQLKWRQKVLVGNLAPLRFPGDSKASALSGWHQNDDSFPQSLTKHSSVIQSSHREQKPFKQHICFIVLWLEPAVGL